MKRSYFGLGLLVALLAVSAAVGWGMERIHQPVFQALTEAEERSYQGDWEGAAALASDAFSHWHTWQEVRSCFADHGPIEEIDAQFAMMNACIRSREREEFPSLAAQTAQMVKAMGDAHGLRWGSFF